MPIKTINKNQIAVLNSRVNDILEVFRYETEDNLTKNIEFFFTSSHGDSTEIYQNVTIVFSNQALYGSTMKNLCELMSSEFGTISYLIVRKGKLYMRLCLYA
jgi:hypothetical protein